MTAARLRLAPMLVVIAWCAIANPPPTKISKTTQPVILLPNLHLAPRLSPPPPIPFHHHRHRHRHGIHLCLLLLLRGHGLHLLGTPPHHPSTTTMTNTALASSTSLRSSRSSLAAARASLPNQPVLYSFQELAAATNNFLAKRGSSDTFWRCSLRALPAPTSLAPHTRGRLRRARPRRALPPRQPRAPPPRRIRYGRKLHRDAAVCRVQV
ncbi:uncharacterized protein LOC125547353 [Triticum urartu]|uniref:uncharacterized protein LOC125547353 n=1 Tax=Triticum urartu TaxID=4572 RepID=UPI002043E6CE|nr:uncharacterized protein LOC125547353 [Triticum urartu]